MICNIACGRFVELALNVDNNTPSTAAFVALLLQVAEADDTVADYDDLDTLLAAAGNTECTATGYSRNSITDTEISAPSLDDTGNRYSVTIPQASLAWNTLSSVTAGTYKMLIVYFDDVADSGVDDTQGVPVAVVTVGSVTTATTDIEASADLVLRATRG